MTGLDTNVLVRYLTQDDPGQARTATTIIEETIADGGRLLLHPVALCELVWVLETAYGQDRAEVAAVLERILRTAQFEIPDKETAWKAWTDFRSGRADFADYLMGHDHRRSGADTTITFDRALKGHPLFRVV